jgi:hypothetical protein
MNLAEVVLLGLLRANITDNCLNEAPIRRLRINEMESMARSKSDVDYGSLQSYNKAVLRACCYGLRRKLDFFRTSAISLFSLYQKIIYAKEEFIEITCAG